jgi:hypothetical protein
MDALQYVHADVPSGVAFAWMFYYTHHSHMDALQYVYGDVPSDDLFYRISYYTHHSDMYVPQYVSPGAVSYRPAH